MPALTKDSTVARTPKQVGTQIEGETVLLELGSGDYFTLNEVGSFIWDCLAAPSTPAKVAAAVVDEYEVEMEQALEDVLTLLGELHTAGLVVASGG